MRKLINISADQQKTGELINILSEELTNKSFSGRFGGEGLIEAFETLRLALIRIYSKITTDELDDLFRRHLELAVNSLLQAELTAFLDYEKYDRAGFNSGNSRNGIIRVRLKQNTEN